MVDGKEVEPERADGDVAAVLDLAELGLLELVLVELALDEPERQPCAEHRHRPVERLEKVRQSARVVLVTVSDDDGAELVLALHDVGEVGQDQIDPGVIVVGEHDAGIDDDHVVTELDDGHVLADLVEPAERDDAEALLLLEACG